MTLGYKSLKNSDEVVYDDPAFSFKSADYVLEGIRLVEPDVGVAIAVIDSTMRPPTEATWGSIRRLLVRVFHILLVGRNELVNEIKVDTIARIELTGNIEQLEQQ